MLASSPSSQKALQQPKNVCSGRAVASPAQQQCRAARGVASAVTDGPRPAVIMHSTVEPCTSLSEPEISLSVCLKLLLGRADEVRVPQTWREVHNVFWQHPTVIVAVCSLTWLASHRLQAPLMVWDAGAVLAGAALWVVQEWFIHAYLFHGNVEWFGKRMHESHHHQPYHHISIDGPDITVPFILGATALFVALLGAQLGASCAFGYVALGLFYQFTHYAVHTRAVPQSSFWRARRQHHMQHHCRNENFWLAFTFPGFDSWMSTNPAAKAVPMTDLARDAVRGKDAAARSGS